MPAISIIMPVYNVEKYIKKAIESILTQTNEDFELIIVNDGTCDDSMTIVDGFASRDCRIKVINQENKGPSAARNTGMRAASGEYICFVDSDDEINENLLKNTTDKINAENPDVLMFGILVEDVGNNEEVLSSHSLNMFPATFTKNTFEQFKIDSDSLSLLGYVWNKLYKRSFLSANKLYFNEAKTFLEDIDFNEEVYKHIQSFIVIDDCLYHYKKRERLSLMNAFRENEFEFQMAAVNSRKAIMQGWRIEQSIIESVIADLQMNVVKYSCTNLFTNKNPLKFKDKCKIIKGILETPLTQERVKFYKPSSMAEKILKMIILNKSNYTLAVVSSVFILKKRVFRIFQT